MKYLRIFENQAAYSAYTESEDYVTPNVCLLEEEKTAVKNKYVPHDYSKDYLTIVSTSDNNTIYWYANSSSETKTISVSTDNGKTWLQKTSNNNTSGETLVTLNNGDKLLIKGNNTFYGSSSSSYDEYYNNFKTTGSFNIEGNIMSLTNGDDFTDKTEIPWAYYGRNFANLFQNCKIIDANNLILPANSLRTLCYKEMFSGCTSLTTAPKILPATTLTQGCYKKMFSNCTSLTTAPELPATTLVPDCYQSMFSGCTSLTTAPELPATTLAGGCYKSMFSGCTSLTTAPVLSATALTQGCYMEMFSDCTSLTTAPELSATALALNCYVGMFSGCTSLTTAPELPATTLAQSCYNGMFGGCTSLTTAPVLSAATLTQSCYRDMFNGCSNLQQVTCLATDISASNCTTTWLKNVAASGTLIKESSMTSWADGVSGIPNGWGVISIDNLPIEWNKSIYSIPINMLTKPVLANPFGLPISYTSSDTNVATIDSNGVVTFISEGTCTLTASFAGDETYSAKTTTCTLNITKYDYGESYFTIISKTDNNKISLIASTYSAANRTVYISTDNGTTWISRLTNTADTFSIVTLNQGEKVLLKTTTKLCTNNDYVFLKTSGDFDVEGNIMSLVYGDNFYGQTILSSSHTFYRLFREAKVVDASHLVLPATTLTQSCYYGMFSGCTSLTTAPELPATTLAQDCYRNMFMSCSNLQQVTCLATNISASNCTNMWVYNVAISGTFIKAPSMSSWTTGISGIPSGWTVQDYAG